MVYMMFSLATICTHQIHRVILKAVEEEEDYQQDNAKFHKVRLVMELF